VRSWEADARQGHGVRVLLRARGTPHLQVVVCLGDQRLHRLRLGEDLRESGGAAPALTVGRQVARARAHPCL